MSKVACVQLAYRGLDHPPGLARVEANLGYLDDMWSRTALGTEDVGLVVLGEFWLPSPAGPKEYGPSAVTTDGAFAGLAGQLCRDHNCYLAANVVELVDGALYDSSVLVSPEGAVVLVYREIAGGLMPESPIGTPLGTATGSLGAPRTARGLGRWIPAVDTDLGRVATVVGSDLLYPELSIGLTLAGADVVLHPCKETLATAGPWQSLKPARALEGGFALVSCNIADSFAHTKTSWSSARGHSAIFDATGSVLAASDTEGEDVVVATIDLDVGRGARQAARFGRRTSPQWREELAALSQPAQD